MKRFSLFILVSVIIVTMSIGIYNFTNKNYLHILHDNIEWQVEYKGIKEAKSFDKDDKGNLYVAFKDRIIMVDNENREKIICSDEVWDIWDIIVDGNKVYIATDNRIIEYDININKWNELLTNIPNNGLNRKMKMLLYKNDLYISIGSATNSGIVNDAKMTPDRASFDWILTGKNYGDILTGAFKNYGQISSKGEKIDGNNISNASIICYDLETKKISTYATGIRNVEGIDYNSKGNIIAIVGGIESEGARAVLDDKDYIYEVKEKSWYGWPDYSGGDPITSPRFNDKNNKIDLLISNSPTKTPYGPLYQHKSVSALSALAVDRDGGCLQKDTIIFVDNKENYIYAINNIGVVNTIVDLGDNSKVEKIKYSNGQIYVLDSRQGEIYKIGNKAILSIFKLPSLIQIFSLIFLLAIIIVLWIKIILKRKHIKLYKKQ